MTFPSCKAARLVGVVILIVLGSGCAQGPPTPCVGLEGWLCGSCAGPTVTCSFDGVEVTAPSCNGCQARRGLIGALCDSGSAATLEEAEEGMVCDDDTDTDG